MGAMSFSRDLSSFLFRRSLVVLVVSAVVLSGCSGGGDEPTEVSKTVEVPADTEGDDAGTDGEAVGEVAPIPFDEFDPADYEVGDVVPEVEIREPVEYPEMVNNDKAGAEAAAQYMIDVLNYTYNTGDSTYLNAVAADDCSLCTEIRNHVNEIAERGGRVVGPTTKLQRKEYYGQLGASWIVNITLYYPDSTVVNKDRQMLGGLTGRGEVERQILVVNESAAAWKFASLGEVAFS